MSKVLQAGAIVIQAGTEPPRVLLVRAKKNPQHWIFPKGHVEAGETESEAARRELREEAGVDGDLAGHVGASEFEFRGQTVHVQYCLFRYLKTVAPGDGRECRWCAVDEALELLSFEDLKDLLRRALPLMDQH